MAVLSFFPVPHFDLPFRFDVTGHAAVADQDSLEDITNCVSAIIHTFVGQRLEVPDFGIEDPVFNNQPIQLQSIIDHILEQEPRAAVLIDQHPDQFDMLIADITVNVSISQGVNT